FMTMRWSAFPLAECCGNGISQFDANFCRFTLPQWESPSHIFSDRLNFVSITVAWSKEFSDAGERCLDMSNYLAFFGAASRFSVIQAVMKRADVACRRRGNKKPASWRGLHLNHKSGTLARSGGGLGDEAYLSARDFGDHSDGRLGRSG